jgi:hypothetical protein
MKKMLMTGLGFAFVTTLSSPATADLAMKRTSQANRANMVQFDPRKVNALVQKTADYARDGILVVLSAAENLADAGGPSAYTTNSGSALLKTVQANKFTGLDNANPVKIVSDQGIQFLLNPAEIDSGLGIGKFTITYYPSLNGQYVEGWTCKTTASTETRLGRGTITHSEGTIEPMFSGLGYPFEMCTIVNTTPTEASD